MIAALGLQGGESLSYQEMIQCFSGLGRVHIGTFRRLLDAFPHSWSVFSWLRTLNRVLQGFLSWFGYLWQGPYVRLLVRWLSRRGINLRCDPCMMAATFVRLIWLSEPLIFSLHAWSKELYTFFPSRRCPIAHDGTWATRLIWMVSICFTYRLFDSMLEVIIALIYRNLMSVYSGCLNFCNGSCASLYIIEVSRDWIVKNIVEINRTVQKTVETIKI